MQRDRAQLRHFEGSLEIVEARIVIAVWMIDG